MGKLCSLLEDAGGMALGGTMSRQQDVPGTAPARGMGSSSSFVSLGGQTRPPNSSGGLALGGSRSSGALQPIAAGRPQRVQR